MPANWPTFITNVTDFIVDEEASNAPTAEAGAEKFGRHVAEEYISAIGPSQSIWGQTRSGGVPGPDSNLISTYKAQFKRLLGEDTTGDGARDTQPDIPNSNTIDDDGNEIPFSGKKSDPNNPSVIQPAAPDPEYADPDMTEVSEPVIDPEEMREFLDEYGSTYNLYTYRYFEFGFEGRETNDELANIISNRILFSFLLETSGNKRQLMYTWINSFGTWLDGNSASATNQRKAFWEKLKASMNNNDYDADYIIGKVKYRTLEQLKLSYEIESTAGIYEKAKLGLPSDMKYNPGKKDFRIKVIQQPFDEDNDSDDYDESPVVSGEFICYFSGQDSMYISSKWNATQLDSKYLKGELKNKWSKIESVSTADDVVNKKNRAAPYMFTRQKTVDALAEIENGDSGDTPYDILAEATIDYWKSTAVQPLSSLPPAPPCLSNLPLGGTYIPVYYGNKKKLAEGLRKALNAGKDSNNKIEAGQKVSKALSLAYARHLMQLKFIYQGGIPVPLVPFVPMIGFVPNVY
jgi:hypothetical protein